MTTWLSPERPVARRQLLAKRGRTLAGIAGIAVALLLVLALKAIFAGMEERLTAYIDGSGADVIVAQQGCADDAHDPVGATRAAVVAIAATSRRGIRGAASSTGRLRRERRRQARHRRYLSAAAPVPNLAEGRVPRAGEIVLDRALGREARLSRAATPCGRSARSFRVSGEVDGHAASPARSPSSRADTLAGMLQAPGVVSYVSSAPGPESLRLELARRDRAARATRDGLDTRELRRAPSGSVVGDMSTDIVRGMILVGFVIGVAVAGLVAYSPDADPAARLRRPARARPARPPRRRRSSSPRSARWSAPASCSRSPGLAAGAVLPALSPTLVLSHPRGRRRSRRQSWPARSRLGAALVPIARVVRVDPASVFRRAS